MVLVRLDGRKMRAKCGDCGAWCSGGRLNGRKKRAKIGGILGPVVAAGRLACESCGIARRERKMRAKLSDCGAWCSGGRLNGRKKRANRCLLANDGRDLFLMAARSVLR